MPSHTKQLTLSFPRSRFDLLRDHAKRSGLSIKMTALAILNRQLARIDAKHPELAGPPPWSTGLHDLPYPHEVIGDAGNEDEFEFDVSLGANRAARLRHLARGFGRNEEKLAAVLVDHELRLLANARHARAADDGPDYGDGSGDGQGDPTDDDKGGFRYL